MELVEINFKINGKPCRISVNPRLTLLELLREELGLTGTKHGCGMGECGACTVLVNSQAVNACLLLAPQIDGCVVETVEGLAHKGRMHKLQQAFRG